MSADEIKSETFIGHSANQAFASPMKYAISAPNIWGEIGERTWDDLLLTSLPATRRDLYASRYTFCTCIGLYAGDQLTSGTLNFLFGPGVGSTFTYESGKLIIVLPQHRLLVADLIKETAEYMDYSDEAACVAPHIRKKLDVHKEIT